MSVTGIMDMELWSSDRKSTFWAAGLSVFVMHPCLRCSDVCIRSAAARVLWTQSFRIHEPFNILRGDDAVKVQHDCRQWLILCNVRTFLLAALINAKNFYIFFESFNTIYSPVDEVQMIPKAAVTRHCLLFLIFFLIIANFNTKATSF